MPEDETPIKTTGIRCPEGNLAATSTVSATRLVNFEPHRRQMKRCLTQLGLLCSPIDTGNRDKGIASIMGLLRIEISSFRGRQGRRR